MKSNLKTSKTSALELVTSDDSVAYGRVSSKEQEEEGYSVPAQLRLLEEYASRKGLHVHKTFVEAETAKKAGRKAFNEMLAYVQEHGIKHILVEKTDRLYRNFTDYVKIDELDVDVHFVKENSVLKKDSHSSEKLMHNIKVCLAKNYIDNLSEEIQKGMKEKALQGIYPSHAPLGYLNALDGTRKKIMPDPNRAALIKRLFKTYAFGSVSLTELTKLAFQWGLRTKKNLKVHKSSIALMLANDVYIGKVKWNGETYEGVHEALVDIGTFTKVQEILHGRTSRLGYGHIDAILYRGLLHCERCGCSLTGEVKKGKYVYYHCIGRREGCDSPYISQDFITQQFETLFESVTIPPDVFEMLKVGLRETSEQERRFQRSERKDLEREAEKLRNRLAEIYEGKLSGEVSDETYVRLRKKYEIELHSLTQQLATFDVARHSWEDRAMRMLELAASAYDRFKQADLSKRAELIKMVCSNSKFDGQKLTYDLKSPYDLILKIQETAKVEQCTEHQENGGNVDWWAQLDSN